MGVAVGSQVWRKVAHFERECICFFLRMRCGGALEMPRRQCWSSRFSVAGRFGCDGNKLKLELQPGRDSAARSDSLCAARRSVCCQTDPVPAELPV